MRYLVLLLGLLLTTTLSGQMTVHFDRPFHVAGEVAWFSVYAPRPAPPKVRVVVYDPAGQVLDYFFLEAEAGAYAGHYRWPFALGTGYYRLGFAALDAAGSVTDLGTVRHAVYADKRTEANAPAPNQTGNGTRAKRPAAGGLTATVANNELRVEGLDYSAYAVSVVNLDVVAADPVFRPTEGATTATAAYVDTLFYPTSVQTAAGEAVTTSLLPVFDPARYAFGFARSQEGAAVLQLAPFTGTKRVQVRDLGGQRLTPTLALPTLPALRATPPVTPAVARYVDLARRRRKIYQLFATVETELEPRGRAEERQTLVPNRSFDVPNYKAFPTMYEFFREVAGELRVRRKKDSYSARLYNAPNQRFFGENPLYIIDGMLTRDDDYVMNLNPARVRYLAFYYVGSELRRDFPALGNNGVVQIETVRGAENFPAADAAEQLPINGLQARADFPARNAAGADVPVLSPLLLWDTGSGIRELTLPLPASDDGGRYRVLVTARAADGTLRSVATVYEQAMR